MGKLAGFRYRQVTSRLKKFGFVFDRQAAGSHEIWYNEQSDRYTTIPNHLGDMRRKASFELSSNKLVFQLTIF